VLLNIPGTSENEEVYLQIFAWDGSYGDSVAGLEACLDAGGFFGATSAGNVNSTYGAIGAALQLPEIGLGPPVGPGTPIFGSFGGETEFGRTIVLASNQYVPEPGTIAIGGLGAAALLLYRRRK
jgi:hypothetical protein